MKSNFTNWNKTFSFTPKAIKGMSMNPKPAPKSTIMYEVASSTADSLTISCTNSRQGSDSLNSLAKRLTVFFQDFSVNRPKLKMYFTYGKPRMMPACNNGWRPRIARVVPRSERASASLRVVDCLSPTFLLLLHTVLYWTTYYAWLHHCYFCYC